MRDRVLTYAITISIVAHLGAAVVIGRTSAARLNAAPIALAPRHLNVELVDLTAKEAPKPDQAPKVSLPHSIPPPPPPRTHVAPPDHLPYAVAAATPRAVPATAPRATAQLPGNPGGKLSIGSTSANGDLRGNWGGGRTPIGWVSGSDDGAGKGSGSGAGVGTPEPPKHADDGPGTRPAPAPAVVNVRVCSESGLLPGRNCKNSKTESFVEGRQPGRNCDKCQPEHKSRLADHADPRLIKDSLPSVPSSVPEGLKLRVEILYTVTAKGDVTDVEVTKSSGYRALDQAVVRTATREWKYEPAVQDGIARSSKKTRGITFST